MQFTLYSQTYKGMLGVLLHIFRILLIVVTLIGNQVHALDHITERAWIEDTTGAKTLEEIQTLPMTAYQDPLARGFGKSIIWIRLKLDPDAKSNAENRDEDLLLVIRPVYLDDIEVYDSLSGSDVYARIGDIHHPKDSIFKSPDFVVPLQRGIEPRDIWLRLSSTSTRQIQAQVFDIADYANDAHKNALLFGLYIGLTALIAIWALIHWILIRDRLVGLFALSNLNALGFGLFALGYVRVLWPEHLPAAYLDSLTSFFSITAVSAAVLFHINFTKEYTPPKWIYWIYPVMIALLPIKLGLIYMGYVTESLELNMMEVLVSPFIFLTAITIPFFSKNAEESTPLLSRFIALSFYVFLVLILVLASLPGLGLLNVGSISLYVVMLHGLITGLLILLMLQYRGYLLRGRYQNSILELERTRMQALHAEQVKEDQSKLFCMLTHELKNPLATMQMRIELSTPGNRELRKLIRDINAVLERCLQSNQYEHKRPEPKLVETDLAKLLHDCISEYPQSTQIRLHSPDSLLVRTDRQLVSIIVANFLENAVKYSHPQSFIDLSLSHDNETEQFVIEIRNPPGVAGFPDPHRVFQKYYRSPSAQRYTGTGLGLYIVQNLVKALNGELLYRPDPSSVGFVCRLPMNN